jgi:hypothetical protein
MSYVDIGSAAIDRAAGIAYNYTFIIKENPANVSGVITLVEIYVPAGFTASNVKVATFTQISENHFTTRDTEDIGNITTGYTIHKVSLDVVTGDYIGIFFTAGSVSRDDSGTGYWYLLGDNIPCADTTFGFQANRTISLYGIEIITTQAVSSILSTTATGNGTINATGEGNITKRGICYNLTGSPTVADSKVEETGSFGTGAFIENLINLSPGTTYHVKAYVYNSVGYRYGAEADFTTLKASPTVTTQDATEVSQNHVKGNGNMTASGGENAIERGFEYGLTKTATWTKKENGSYPAGAFYLTIEENLQANTEYWYRAYAKNTVDPFYGYGEWVQFQTSATGTIPTGTKLSICSDYSGYTYKLNASLTDDGETYESFFVLSTDLVGGQGLHINKRLLDIFSYFIKKESGTAKIYIKQDNEAEWNYSGEVSLVGNEDIVIPHLPVDYLAKHYLIKFVFTNDFEFVGLITEAIPIGGR